MSHEHNMDTLLLFQRAGLGRQDRRQMELIALYETMTQKGLAEGDNIMSPRAPEVVRDGMAWRDRSE